MGHVANGQLTGYGIAKSLTSANPSSGVLRRLATCGGIDLADFATTTGLPDTTTPIPAALSSSSWVAGQAAARISELTWSYG